MNLTTRNKPVFVISNFCWRSESANRILFLPYVFVLKCRPLKYKIIPISFSSDYDTWAHEMTVPPPKGFSAYYVPERMRTRFPPLYLSFLHFPFLGFHMPQTTLITGYSSWKQWFRFTSCLQIGTKYTTQDQRCLWNYVCYLLNDTRFLSR